MSGLDFQQEYKSDELAEECFRQLVELSLLREKKRRAEFGFVGRYGSNDIGLRGCDEKGCADCARFGDERLCVWW